MLECGWQNIVGLWLEGFSAADGRQGTVCLGLCCGVHGNSCCQTRVIPHCANMYITCCYNMRRGKSTHTMVNVSTYCTRGLVGPLQDLGPHDKTKTLCLQRMCCNMSKNTRYNRQQPTHNEQYIAQQRLGAPAPANNNALCCWSTSLAASTRQQL